MVTSLTEEVVLKDGVIASWTSAYGEACAERDQDRWARERATAELQNAMRQNAALREAAVAPPAVLERTQAERKSK